MQKVKHAFHGCLDVGGAHAGTGTDGRAICQRRFVGEE